MAGEESKSGFPWIIVIVVLIIAAGAYYYITYMQPAVPEEPEDIYGPQLEALNSEIANAGTSSAVETARTKVNDIKDKLTGSYAKYLPLAEAQLAVLDMIDLNLEYINEADSYTEVDCSKDYTSFLSDMEGAEAKLNSAKSKVNSYINTDPNSTATLLLNKLNTIDAAGMAVFAEMIERDYSKNCVAEETAEGVYPTPLTKEEALNLVVNEIVKDNDYYVYMIDTPLEPGTIVTIKRPEGDYNVSITENTWLLFVDEEPGAPFAHPTKIVLISQATAKYRVYDSQYYPIVNGVSYWSTMEERMNESYIAYPEDPDLDVELVESTTYEYRYYYDSMGAPGSGVPTGTSVPFDDDLCCEGVEKKKFGLVIQGYDEPMFKSDTVNAYNMLKGRGYSNADINYLTADAGDALSDGQTTLANVAAALANIGTNADCCDEVFIYISSHGASAQQWQYKNKATGETTWTSSAASLPGGVANWEYTGNTAKHHMVELNPQFTTPSPTPGGAPVTHGSPNGGKAWSTAIATYLDNIDSCYVTVMYFSCYSGTAANALAGKGRTIITPVGDRPAWGRSTPGFGSYFTNWFIEAKGQGKSDKEAFDYAKQKTSADAAAKGRVQTGTWTSSTERCRCCHVVCDESDYICKVIAGEGIDSPLCPKVGDYCGETPPPPPGHYECTAESLCEFVMGEGEDSCQTDEDCRDWIPPPVGHYECSDEETCDFVLGEGEDSCQTDEDCRYDDAVCGDGTITPPEGCDWGSPNTNKCPEGTYCTIDCECKDLETTEVCGDGKISLPDEECDGGNILFDICPPGYECRICKCEPLEIWCGDGKIDPPEECDHGNTITERCENTGEVCQSCQCIPRDEATHAECVDEKCVEVQGYGEDLCWSDSQCEEPTHSECHNEACIEVEGEGADECWTDEDCYEEEPEDYGICGDDVIDEPWEECEWDDDCYENEICIECLCYEIPAYCGNGVIDAGEECEDHSDCSEEQACGGNCRCVDPPSLDCEYICGQMNLPIILGHGYATVEACGEAAEEDPTPCHTTCIKYGFERIDNIAGWDSCCCKKRELFPCSDCPGQNPVCPPCPSGYQ